MALRLRQLQLLHRHGDRTPLRNVFRGSAAPAEELDERRMWERQLPTAGRLHALRAKFAVDESGDQGAASGAAAAVTGLQQRPFGYLTTRGIEQMVHRGERVRDFCEREELAVDALTPSDVQIFSNAYTRTQLSVQALLTGLFQDTPHVELPVRVLPPAVDMINTYAAFPEIAQLKQDLERDDAAFAHRENEMRRVKSELMESLPMFASGVVPFTWMYAADYFMCRRAHNVPFVKGTETIGDATVQHLGFRFHQFYAHKRILELVAGRLVHNAHREMNTAVAEHPDSKKLIVYSGHDVSILSVLHALGASIVDDFTWWPEYSSALALELLEDESGRWFVRLRLDGEVIELSHSPSPLIPLDEFAALVADRVGLPPP